MPETRPLAPDELRFIKSDYLGAYLRPSSYIERVSSALQVISHPKIKDTFDAIACVGNSGVLAAGPLSMCTDKPIILVRKPKQTEHTACIVEGAYDSLSYVIVDDMTVTGATLAYVQQSINRYYDSQLGISNPECRGYLMLNERHYAESRQVNIGTLDSPNWVSNLRWEYEYNNFLK